MPTSAVFTKLNLRDLTDIVVLNAPQSFEAELKGLRGVTVRRVLTMRSTAKFVLAFVMQQKQVDALASVIARAAPGDAVVWFAYPKGTSKRYTCEINRDSGWEALGDAGFEGVRMVAIDEDWSAFRVRRTEFIKSMKRSAAGVMSKAGKARLASRKT